MLYISTVVQLESTRRKHLTPASETRVQKKNCQLSSTQRKIMLKHQRSVKIIPLHAMSKMKKHEKKRVPGFPPDFASSRGSSSAASTRPRTDPPQATGRRPPPPRRPPSSRRRRSEGGLYPWNPISTLAKSNEEITYQRSRISESRRLTYDRIAQG